MSYYVLNVDMRPFPDETYVVRGDDLDAVQAKDRVIDWLASLHGEADVAEWGWERGPEGAGFLDLEGPFDTALDAVRSRGYLDGEDERRMADDADTDGVAHFQSY